MLDCSISFIKVKHIGVILYIDVKVTFNNCFSSLSCWKAMFKIFGITKEEAY